MCDHTEPEIAAQTELQRHRAAGLYFAYGRRGCDRLVEARKVVLRDRDSMVSRIEVLEFTGSLRNKAPGALVGPDTSVQPGPRRIDIVKSRPIESLACGKGLQCRQKLVWMGHGRFRCPDYIYRLST